MQEDLSPLARELRKETCPRRVIEETERRIATETAPPGRLRHALPVTLALAGVVILGGLLVRPRLTGDNPGRQRQSVQQQAQRRQVARETETALDLIGMALLDAGAHSETVISDRVIPPLRAGLQTAKNKIMRPTEL